MKKLLLLFALLLVPSLAVAAEYGASAGEVPMFHISRLSVTLGAQHEEWTGDRLAGIDRSDWTAGLAGAYNLHRGDPATSIGRTSLVGSIFRVVDRNEFRATIGVRITVFAGR